VPGEIIRTCRRPLVVAAFDPPGAAEAYRAWLDEHADVIAAVPPTDMQVEYGRRGGGLYIRVRIDEAALPEGLAPLEPPPPAAA